MKNSTRSLEEMLASLTRNDRQLVLGDYNAKIVKTDSTDAFCRVVGSYGLGIRNERGDELFQFCVE